MRSVSVFLTIMTLLMGALFGTAWAAGAPGSQAAVTMDTTVVTASREAESQTTVPANTTIYTDTQIAKTNAGNVPELLTLLTGVQVSNVTGNKRSYTVDLRGFGESAAANVLVLVDGRRINQADLSGVDWTLIPLERIARIEIIRGGRGSVIYGDNATGGVINIITKQGEKFNTSATLKYGSYNTFNGHADLSGSVETFSYALSANYANSDGYRDNSETEAKDVGLNLRWDTSDALALSLSGGWHDDRASLPGTILQSEFDAGMDRTATSTPDDFADVEDRNLKLGLETYFLTDSSFKIDLWGRERKSVAFSSFAGGTFEGDTTIDTVGISPQLVIKEKVGNLPNRLIVGADVIESQEDITNSSVFFGFASTGIFELKKENYGVFIHDELTVMPGLTASAGYRYDKAKFTFSPASPSETSLDENLWTAGLNYAYAPQSHVYAAYNRSFRYPLLDEIFNFFTNTIDTGLMPQTSDGIDLGVTHALSDSLSTTVNFFWIDTQDEIVYNPGSFTNQNLDGDTSRRGLELSLAYRWKQLNADLGYTFTEAKIKGGQFDGSQVPNVPEHKANLNLIYQFQNGLSLGLNGIYVGERPFISDFGNTAGDQDSYLVLNAKINYQWKQYAIFLNINNLTNEDYAEYGVLGGFPVERAYYPSPEINFLGGVSVAF